MPFVPNYLKQFEKPNNHWTNLIHPFTHSHTSSYLFFATNYTNTNSRARHKRSLTHHHYTALLIHQVNTHLDVSNNNLFPFTRNVVASRILRAGRRSVDPFSLSAFPHSAKHKVIDTPLTPTYSPRINYAYSNYKTVYVDIASDFDCRPIDRTMTERLRWRTRLERRLKRFPGTAASGRMLPLV